MRIAIALIAALAAAPVMAAPLELHRGVAVHEWLNWSPLEPDGSYRFAQPLKYRIIESPAHRPRSGHGR